MLKRKYVLTFLAVLTAALLVGAGVRSVAFSNQQSIAGSRAMENFGRESS